MPTLGTQNISDSYPQLLKTFGLGGLDGNLQIVTDGDNTSSALKISTTGVNSSGSLSVDGATTLTGAVTFGTSITASTGTATLGTVTISTATISTATIPSLLGTVTFGSNITASTGTATIGTATISTATISTATISTATIPNILGATTFASTITASTGTNTLGTISSNFVTAGTLEIGATGPSITNMTYGTAAFTAATVAAYNAAGTTNGTVALTGVAINDIVIGSLNSLGSASGSTGLIIGFHPVASNVVRYSIANPTTTAGTVPAGVLHMTALRFIP